MRNLFNVCFGQTHRFRDVRDMSGLPQTADISGPGRHFAFVPQSDIHQDNGPRRERDLLWLIERSPHFVQQLPSER
jgi:hypothetical protein